MIPNTQRASEILEAKSPTYAHAQRRPGLSVVILNLNKPELLLPLLRQLIGCQALFARHSLTLELLVGDTGSTDPQVLSFYEEHAGQLKVARNLRYQFSANNNALAFGESTCGQLLFLNNDVLFAGDGSSLLDFYRKHAAGASAGVSGAVLYFPDGRVQHAGVFFSPHPQSHALPLHIGAGEAPSFKFPEQKDVPAVTGACLMVSSENFLRAGGFDEGYAAECQDVALSLVLHRLGATNRLFDLGQTLHIENATRPRGEAHAGDRARFLRRWRVYVESVFL